MSGRDVMANWRDINQAPKDGSFVIAAAKSAWVKAFDHFPYPFEQRWNGDAWEAKDGHVYEPQPTHFLVAEAGRRALSEQEQGK